MLMQQTTLRIPHYDMANFLVVFVQPTNTRGAALSGRLVLRLPPENQTRSMAEQPHSIDIGPPAHFKDADTGFDIVYGLEGLHHQTELQAALELVLYPDSQPAFSSYLDDAVLRVWIVMVVPYGYDVFFGLTPEFWEH